MDYPIGGINFHSPSSSFMENYRGDGSLYREVHFAHGYKRLLDKSWHPFNKVRFGVNQGQSTAQWHNNYNVGTKGDYFFLQTGKTVHPDSGVGVHQHFQLSAAMPPKPTNPAIAFSISKATHEVVEWLVPESSTPQFSYNFDVDGKHVASGIDPQKRSITLSHVKGQKVTVTLEDLLGETTTMSKVIV